MMSLQDIILKLSSFWTKKGCVLGLPYDVEKGAGTFNPLTLLKLTDKKKWKVAYVEPSRRPQDGRYGENPFRLYKHLQFQVILKPAPRDCRFLYLKSLSSIGIDIEQHDVRFMEDNWESPSLGAFGKGWEVRLDGLEITQFTYFQTIGGKKLELIPVELTYGLERIAMFLNKKKNVFDVPWNDEVSYGEMRKEEERQFCVYYFEKAHSAKFIEFFEFYEDEAKKLIEAKLPYPAYDCLLKMSHYFNVAEAGGSLEHSRRTDFIRRMQTIASAIIRGQV